MLVPGRAGPGRPFGHLYVPSLERTPGPVLLLPVPQTELHDVITYTWVVAAVAYLTRAMHDSLKKKKTRAMHDGRHKGGKR